MMTPDEYEPIARRLAHDVGMTYFDDTTYQPERLMFWPSHSRDAEYVYKDSSGKLLSVDSVLATYPDWADSSFWPTSPGTDARRKKELKQQGDPLTKKGTVGAFCRAYDIHRALDELLSDIYSPTDKEDRYTYLQGSTSGGLVIYNDLFAYSHHGTDPAGDKLTNAFDLVRIHKFGDLDEDAKDNARANKLPSFKAMVEWANDMEEIRAARLNEALGDFDDLDEGVEDLRDWATLNENGDMEINPFLLAQQILREIPIYYDGFELLRYSAKRGVWLADCEEFLKSYISRRKLIKETKIRHLNETMASLKALSHREEAFMDGDINKIVLQNGIYDVASGEFSDEFDPDLHARSSHPIEFKEEADCPTFKGFLDAVVGEENCDFVFEWFGYNFYRDYSIQKMLFVHGKGGTGKSTVINILRDMIGHENYAAVTLQHLMVERFAKIGLYRKVSNFDTDAKPQYLADGATLKMLTGEDAIYADRKNKEPITFYNYAKLTFAMNELPPMRDFSGGLKRRMLILEMNTVLTKAIKEAYPLDTIKAERAGIFNESMKALRRLLARKAFTTSDGMRASVSDWEKGNDVVALFLEEECEIGPDFTNPVKEMYANYKYYCEDSGYKPMSRNTFKQRMEELGHENKLAWNGKTSVRVWAGIREKEEGRL